MPTCTRHVCAEWLGHTEEIADTHYRMTRDTHYETAITTTVTQQVMVRKTARCVTESGGTGVNGESMTTTRPLAEGSKHTVITGHSDAVVANDPMTPTGFEPVLPG